MLHSREPSLVEREAARKIVDAVGGNAGFGTTVATVARLVAADHPTHQQSVMRFCVAYIREMSLQQWPDARNQASVTLATLLVERMNEEDVDTCLPLI